MVRTFKIYLLRDLLPLLMPGACVHPLHMVLTVGWALSLTAMSRDLGVEIFLVVTHVQNGRLSREGTKGARIRYSHCEIRRFLFFGESQTLPCVLATLFLALCMVLHVHIFCVPTSRSKVSSLPSDF